MGLAEYRRKRDFHATPEPAAGGARGGGIFVVQLHHARRRHYDFRLEHAGTLKSWAVPKGPSFDPAVKRMAVQVEDHPISYAGFEGDIPAGHYGAGHVDLFDRGTWEPLGNVREGLARGELKFILHGDVLRGSWVLVRTRNDAAKPQWLLIKHRDDFAGPREADDFVDPATDRPLPAAERARTWSGVKTAARAKPAAPKRRKRTRREPVAPQAFAPELCRLQPRVPAGDDWLHEAKWDGYRIVATIDRRGGVRLWSRNALEWTDKVPELVDALRTLGLRDTQLDGEMIALHDGRDDFNALQGRLSGENRAPLAYMLFDLPHLDGESLRERPLVERKAALEALLAAHPHPLLRYSAHQRGHGAKVWAQAQANGLEGVVSKRADSAYRGARNGDWVKVKSRASQEFVVVGYTQPKGGRTAFGALLLGRPTADGFDYAGRVGTGFSDELLAELGARLGRLQVDAPVVPTTRLTAAERATARWVRPTVVVEVYHQGIGGQGLLRQPSLKGLREDVTVETLRKAAKAARSGTRKPGATRAKVAAPEVRLTHPERIVYAEGGYTKRDVADYYAAVGERLLEGIANRPLSVVRCPDGTGKACFFQKHAGQGWGDHVRAVPVREKAGTARYLAVDDLDGVLQLVQMNAIEFHAWGTHADDLARCDRLVFDLDPHADVDWGTVKAAARLVRDALEALGLRSFLRTSGGKGLHVVVPLNPPAPWDDAKRFSQWFATTLASERDDLFVAKAGEAKRAGRIFIDWLRNARGATSVASYSLRARPGAPVAMPIAWTELTRLKPSAQFTIRTVPTTLRRRRKDPWAGFDRVRQALPRIDAARGKRRA